MNSLAVANMKNYFKLSLLLLQGMKMKGNTSDTSSGCFYCSGIIVFFINPPLVFLPITSMVYFLILVVVILSIAVYQLYTQNLKLSKNNPSIENVNTENNNIKVIENETVTVPLLADESIFIAEHESSTELIKVQRQSESFTEGHDADMGLMLIVEDSEASREFMKEIFLPSYRILEASNGKEGLELAMQYIPDIIISDVVMPEMDGNTLCNIVKNSVSTSHIPVILLTIRSSVDQKREGYEMGADAYVTKPFSKGLLESRVNNLLKSRVQLKAHYARTFLLQLPDAASPSADESFLSQLVAIIEQSVGEPDFDVNKLALEFNFSRAVLYRKVKALTNLSLIELIRKVRLKKAAQLLRTKQYRVSEVAFLVGFNDLKHFRSCFKEQFHVSPSELLKGESEVKLPL